MNNPGEKNNDLLAIRNFVQKFKVECVTGFLFLAMYVPTFIWMWDRWFVRDSYYSHGILVPFVSGFFIWQKWSKLSKMPRVESVWGLRLVVFGVLIHVVSSVLRIYFTSGFSMLIVGSGLILHFCGMAIFKELLFPIAFLIFMIPLPMVVVTNISFRLKMFAAQLATNTLNSMRIPAIREGSVIKMQTAYVIVDDVCSGLRSLISLTALASVFAYGMKKKWFKRAILFFSAIPIAVVTNACRVIFLSAVSEIWGTKYASGFVHDLSGFMVFGLAFVMLVIIGKLMD